MMFDKILDKKVIVIFFFIGYFIIGIGVVADYGIALDEDYQRIIAQNRLDYIKIFLSNLFSHTDNFVQDNVELKWPEYGVVFELPALWIEKIIGYTATRSQYFFRHYLIFFVSFIGIIFFYLLALKKFNSWKLALLSIIFLASSPRIFAESFYNSKDIVFMYLFTVNTFFAIIFLEKPSPYNAFTLSFISALCIGVRIGGIFLTIIVLFFLLIKYLRKDYKYKITSSVLILLSTLFFFTILFWPTLWENPINNFINTITSFKSYEHNMFNFYLGSYTSSKANYWYYIPLWICITTPILIVIFFIYGFLLSIRRIFYRLTNITIDKKLNDLWRGPIEFQNLLYTTLIFVPIFLTIIFKSTLYSGWRHFYFIYPFIVLIGIDAIRIVYIKLKNLRSHNIKKIFNFIISVFIISNFYWLYKSHPFQNIYFNFLAGDKPHNNFEVDYWGLSNRFVLEKILSEDNNANINVSAVSVTSLGQSFNILSTDQKKRIQYSKDLKSSDYIINNNIFMWGDINKFKKIPNNFDVYYELFVGDILVTTIYKRND